MSVVVVGLQHRRTSLDVLERVSVAESDAPKVRATLRDCLNLEEVVLLSTCLRTEVYAVVDRFHDAVDEIEAVLAERAGEEPEQLADQFEVLFDDDVVTHLFRVAAGLESAVPGESEVLGQVRQAFAQAGEEGLSGPVLGSLFRHALMTGKRVRTDTAIGEGTTSFAHAAVELAEQARPTGLSSASVVVAGAGSMGRGVVTALVGRPPSRQPGAVLVASRRRRSAEALVTDITGKAKEGTPQPPLRSGRVTELGPLVGGADVLIAALDVDAPVLGPEDLAPPTGRSDHPLVVVDMGMPRNVAAGASAVPGVTLLDLDDLRASVDGARNGRQLQLADAEAIVADEVKRYRQATRELGAAPVIAAFRSRLEELRRGELDRRGQALSGLDVPMQDTVDQVTRSVVNKLVHQPIVTLKQEAGTPRGERLVEALRILFDL